MFDPKAEKYAIAFIDFLGTKEFINSDSDNQFLKAFRIMSDIALTGCKRLLAEDGVSVKMFSDNIVLCKKVNYADVDPDNAHAKALISVIAATSYIQYYALDKLGLLIRGGFGVGDLYIDELMVWWKALVSTYTIESTLSIYPRVVFDPEAIETIYGKAIIANKWMAKDEDGFYYIDFLQIHWASFSKAAREKAYNKFNYENQKQIDNFKGKYSIISKRYWHQSYLDKKNIQFIVADVYSTSPTDIKIATPPTPRTVDPTATTPDV